MAIEETARPNWSRLLLALFEQTALSILQWQVGLLNPAGDRLWPLLNLASKLLVSRHRFAQRVAVEFPMTNYLAPQRREHGRDRGGWALESRHADWRFAFWCAGEVN